MHWGHWVLGKKYPTEQKYFTAPKALSGLLLMMLHIVEFASPRLLEIPPPRMWAELLLMFAYFTERVPIFEIAPPWQNA
jgi:hypothetical protein